MIFVFQVTLSQCKLQMRINIRWLQQDSNPQPQPVGFWVRILLQSLNIQIHVCFEQSEDSL